jgi:hypothetical protein
VPDLWSKAKISITFLQIMASLNVAYTIPWPGHFRRVLEKLYVINLNVLSMPGLAYSCVAHVNYFDEFHVAIIFPFVLTLFFLLVHHIGMTVIHRKARKTPHPTPPFLLLSLSHTLQPSANSLITLYLHSVCRCRPTRR